MQVLVRDSVEIGSWSVPLPVALAVGAILYFVFAELGLELATLHEAASPVWPASGLAVALICHFGFRTWPAIAIGAFVANAVIGDTIPSAVIAAGNTLEGLAGAYILTKARKRTSEDFIFAESLGIVLAAAFATMISASIGVSTLIVSGSLSSEIAGATWFTWWMGDALGVLGIAPTILAVGRRGVPGSATWPDILVRVCFLSTAVLAILAISFASEVGAVIFLAFPVVLLASRWFGRLGSSWTALSLSVGLIAQVLLHGGPFYGGHLNDNLLDLQIFLAGLTISTLVLADLKGLDLRVPAVVLVIASGLAAVEFSVGVREGSRIDEMHFDRLIESANARIQERMGIYLTALRGGRSLFAASDKVTRTEWSEFTDSFEIFQHNPGITGMGVVLPVSTGEVAEFVATMRADGAPAFALKSLRGNQDAGAEDGIHFVIAYCEPMHANAAAIGFDVASEPTRRAAAIAARDTGEPTISGQIVPVQDERQRKGFLLFVPMYGSLHAPSDEAGRRDQFKGWIYAAFVAEVFFGEALAPWKGEIEARIHDGKASPSSVVAETFTGERGLPSLARWSRTRPVVLAGHTFTIEWSGGPRFETEGIRTSVLMAVALVLLGTLLAALVANLHSLRIRARRIAETMTEALRASNERFALAITGSNDGVWDWNMAQGTLWTSPRCAQMLGYDVSEAPEDVAGWRAPLLPEDMALTKERFAQIDAGETDRFDAVRRYRHKSGHIVHIHSQGIAVRAPDGSVVRMVGTDTDITPLIKADARLRDAIASMDSGFAMFDSNDRLLVHNDAFVDEGTRKTMPNLVGHTYEEIMRVFAYGELTAVDALNDREAWLAWRMQMHRHQPEKPIEIQWTDGRWMRVHERRTADGGTVGTWTDITAIKQAEQRLVTAINAMDSGFALFDSHDRLVIHNHGFIDKSISDSFGGDARGKTFEEIITKFAYSGVTAVAALLDRDEWIERRIEQHRNPTGEPFEQQLTDGQWVRITEQRTSDGGYIGTWTDITALKRAEARLMDAIESIQDGFALLDADNRFVIVNRRFVDMYPESGDLARPGARFEDMLRRGAQKGEYPNVKTPEEIDAFVNHWIEVYARREHYVGERQLKDGRWILVSQCPTSDGGYVSLRTDITAQKQKEIDLRAAKDEVEARSAQLVNLAEDLQVARMAADQANAGKSQFLANMAHELRTPLNAINGFSEIILSELFGAIQPPKYREYAGLIHQGGTHLLSLINDILDLSKIEAGKLELFIEAVPTDQIAYQAVETVRKMAEERKVALHADLAADCPILHTDARAIRQILLNLLSNAVKFTPAKGSVTLAIKRVDQQGVSISVADTGIGMNEEDMFKALEPYGQVESDLSKKHKGTGLGLPLVKSLAQLHSGTMSLSSEKGKGTIVVVTLPWRPDLPQSL
jgi:PAS domain S-box-containing protein